MPTPPAADKRMGRWLWAIIDLAVVVVATLLAAWFRYDFGTQAFAAPVWQFAGVAAAAHLVLGALFGPYAVGHLRGSYEEIIDLTRTVLLWAVPLQVVTVMGPWDLGPRSLPFTAGTAALVGMFGARFVLRTVRSRIDPKSGSEARLLVFGAGEGGRQLVRALVRDPAAQMTPVGLLDDDRSKRRMRIDGVRVLGSSADLTMVAAHHHATTLAIAVPSAEPAL
ncbi:nucleoside-diphosphate sugar epimerase/dehydratase [Janibacter alittae]|uniref:Polysaccharide biosynthesis protein n=1 Tax=Janibacter alittae TaxID=3115209 RepID=A0ABZ2MJL2_9MICO